MESSEVTDDTEASNKSSEVSETKYEIVKLVMDWKPAKAIFVMIVIVLILTFGPPIYHYVHDRIQDVMNLP